MHTKYIPIKFPSDESAHDYVVEWWYFNGHLKDEDNNEYSFMDCLFKVDVPKVRIPFLSKIPLKTSYFSHALVTDLSSKKFYHRISPLSIVSRDSFSKPLLYVKYFNPEIKNKPIDCVIEKIAESKYHLKNEYIDLILISTKKPLLEGGKGYLNLNSKTTYYYSLTNLVADGKIKIKNKWIKVKGKSWMDHQWADTEYSLDKWDWFSIQLDNETDMVCCVYDDKKVKTYFADISYKDGKQEHYDDLEIIPQEKSWTSQKSKAVYPLSWKIKIPEKKIELDLVTKIDNQEMLFGSINYWEGPLKVAGSFGAEKVAGVGFMELVGYPSEYTNIQYLSDEIGKTASRWISMMKGRADYLVESFKKKISE